MSILKIKVMNTFDINDPEPSFVYVQKEGTSTPSPPKGLERGKSKTYQIDENQYLDIWSKKNNEPIRCTIKIPMSKNISFERLPFKLDMSKRKKKWTITNQSEPTDSEPTAFDAAHSESKNSNINVNVGDDDQ